MTIVEDRVAELEAELAAKQRTIDALLDAAEQRQETLAPGFAAWRETAALEQRVSRRTAHLSRALAVLQQRTARYRTQVEDFAVLRAVLDAVPAAIFWTNADGTCLGANLNFARLVGIADVEHTVGRRPDELLADCADEVAELHHHVLSTGARSQPVEVTIADDDGPQVPYFLSMVPLREEANVVGTLGTLVDIREVRTLERQLAQAQRLESIGALAAGIAHEINTPLQYITGHLYFLERAGERFQKAAAGLADIRATLPPDDAAREEEVLRQEKIAFALDNYPTAVAEALEGVETVSRIVRAMKEFAHPGGEEKVLTDINAALGSTLVVCKNAYKYAAEAVTELDPELPFVPALEGEIKQVLVNLIVNAADAIVERQAAGDAARGCITVSTGVNAAGDAVEIRITDDGTGIPAHIQDRIFDPFFTTKDVGKGSGQGLALAHQCIVARHGGRISVKSEVGVGSTFVLSLPLEVAP